METSVPTTPVAPTPADQWVGATQFLGHDLPLPSGNVARVKRITPAAFLNDGDIPDALSDIIRRAIHTKKGLNPKDLEQISDDPSKLAGALEMLDRILVRVMVAPKAEMPPACDVAVEDGICGLYANQEVHETPTRSGHHRYNEGERTPGVLYADVVDINDKMFIFQWAVGGDANLERFRAELQSSVESVQDSDDVPLPSI